MVLATPSFRLAPPCGADTVGIGQADMCWANFWQTAQRSVMAPFSAPIYEDKFIVLVKVAASSGASSYWDTFAKPFEPFTGALWALIFVSFGFVGITLTFENMEDGDAKISFWDFAVKHAPLGALKGFFAYTSGDISSGIDLTTSGSWLTSFAIGFSVLVLMTG